MPSSSAQHSLASWKQSLPSKRQASTLHAVSHMPSLTHASGQPSLHGVSEYEYDALAENPESMTDCAAAAAERIVYIVEVTACRQTHRYARYLHGC